MQNSVLYELQDMWCITHHTSNIICRTSRQRLLQMYDRARHVRGPWRFDATWTSIHTLQKEVYLINRILHMIIKLVGAINDLLWGDLIILEFSGGEVQFGLSLLVLILIPAGLYFTFKTKFLPFRLFPEMIRVTLEKDEAKKDENSISGVQALIVATATRGQRESQCGG